MKVKLDEESNVFVVHPDDEPELPPLDEVELEPCDDGMGDVSTFQTTNEPIRWVFSSGTVLRWEIADPHGRIVAQGEA